jgi:hypothetical protein
MPTTYSTTMTVAMAGLIYDMRNITVESYACESASILFGSAVIAGTDPRKQVKVGATGGSFRGIALHEHAHEQNPSTGVASYLQYETVNVLRKGAVWVQTNATVAENAAAYYVTATGLWGASGETTGGIYRSATTGSGLAIVEIDL